MVTETENLWDEKGCNGWKIGGNTTKSERCTNFHEVEFRWWNFFVRTHLRVNHFSRHSIGETAAAYWERYTILLLNYSGGEEENLRKNLKNGWKGGGEHAPLILCYQILVGEKSSTKPVEQSI